MIQRHAPGPAAFTYSGTHVRTIERDAIAEALTAILEPGGYRRRDSSADIAMRPANRFLISPPLNGWITILPSNDMDGREYVWAESISRTGAPAIWLYCYQHELAMYRLYRGGQLVDRFHTSTLQNAASGNPRALRPYLFQGATVEELDRALRPGAGDAHDPFQRFAEIGRLLGLLTGEISYDIVMEYGLEQTVPTPDAWQRLDFDFIA